MANESQRDGWCDMDGQYSIIVFVLLFGFVTVVGFVAGRWRQGDLGQLQEWGLGGRRFGPLVTWFLLGGDLYTAYTFVAVPALIFGGPFVAGGGVLVWHGIKRLRRPQ